MRFGSLIHTGLEAYWLALRAQALPHAAPDTTPLEAAYAAMLPHAVDEYDCARAETLMLGYDARWGADNDDLDVLGVESEFATELVNPSTGAPSRTFQLAGKIDAVVRRRSTRADYIVEHKSTTADIGPGSAYWERLQIDSQVSTYYAGARALGFEPQGVIYDVLTRPRHQPLEATPLDARSYRKDGTLYARQRAEAETPEQFRARVMAAIVSEPHRYYQRGTVVRLETEEVDAAHDAWQIAQLVRDAQRTSRWPRNADACERYGRMCSYFAVCTGRARIDDPALYEQLTDTHAELSAAIQSGTGTTVTVT
jgi:hypothetical protein